jgi:hypothetical protein
VADVLHGGGAASGPFAEGARALHPNVQRDPERFERWRACLCVEELDPEQAGEAEG